MSYTYPPSFRQLTDPYYKPEYARSPQVDSIIEDNEEIFENPFVPCTYGWVGEASVDAQNAWVEEMVERERQEVVGVCPATVMPKPPPTPRKKMVKFAEQLAVPQRAAPYATTSRRGRSKKDEDDQSPCASPKKRPTRRRSPEKPATTKVPKAPRSRS
jgi:hypothetical protein